jgi:phosphoadenosine phosphosulfate reductase
VEERYRLRIAVLAPEAEAVEHYVRLNGINGFYASVAQRRDCCGVRKVAPLKRALAGAGAWVTGQRREQSPTRGAIAEAEWDAVHQIDKFNPLAAWTGDDVWAYVRARDVPVNALHAQGFPSIGCAPCTRAVLPGEDARAGRWWWEDVAHKECGLHPQAQQAAVAAGAERA